MAEEGAESTPPQEGEASVESQRKEALRAFFANVEAKLSSEDSKGIVSGLNVVGEALEKRVPAFLGAASGAGLHNRVLAAGDKLLAMEDPGSCVKALRCYAELLRVAGEGHGESQRASDIARTVRTFAQLADTVLEKSAGASPGKGSPKKDGSKELSQNFPLVVEALTRTYGVYGLTSTKLVVLSDALASQLQAILVGGKDKQSALVTDNLLAFLSSAPLRFPADGKTFQSVVETTLDIALGPFRQFQESQKAQAGEGEGEEAAAAEPVAPFEMQEAYLVALAAAAAVVARNRDLMSDAMLVSWASQAVELNACLHGQYQEEMKDKPREAKMPPVAGGPLVAELFACAASRAGAGAGEGEGLGGLAGKCIEAGFHSLLGEKIRLFVHGPRKEEEEEVAEESGSPTKKQQEAESDEGEEDSVSEQEAALVLSVANALFRISGEEERAALYKGVNAIVLGKREEAPAAPADADAGGEEAGAADGAAAADGDGENKADEGAAKAEEGQGGGDGAAAEAEAEAEEQAEAEEEEEEDALVTALLSIASGDLDFESVRPPSEAEESAAPAEEDSPAEGGEEGAKEEGEGQAEGAEESGGDKDAAEGEEAPAAAAAEAEAPKQRPVAFLVQDASAQVLYTLATSGHLSKHFAGVCVPSTVVKILGADRAAGVPESVLAKLLVVLLYVDTDQGKARAAMELSCLSLGKGEASEALNVANSLCVMSSFKIDLEALLPIKCPPKPSPPPTPPPPPLATNKFLWDALGRPDMVDGGNLPTLKMPLPKPTQASGSAA